MTWASIIAMGVSLAQTQAKLPRSYFEAVCLWEDDVDTAEFEANVEREKALSKARARGSM